MLIECWTVALLAVCWYLNYMHCIYHSGIEYHTLDLVIILSEVNPAAVCKNVKWSYLSNSAKNEEKNTFYTMHVPTVLHVFLTVC